MHIVTTVSTRAPVILTWASEKPVCYNQYIEEYKTNVNNKWIALEAHTTAKCMSNENYVSALMMKDKNVRNAHVEMALQQLAVQEKYAVFIKEMG